ncbi:mechanosensitive ion channel domain-containing protein [Granulibacter bethesdensis]|uniref:mechanosensitive ion channel domain-containing protein n=1 Tax=Granulibacter bethesdensis TaxID=364410 RepID=UPI00090A5B14|nr:mechanosensitive ion channel domain-containing protein [Granulibacter bethesdensis]APH59565.1 Mechanosensitive ion channel [Granulibacter bethesdensis]
MPENALIMPFSGIMKPGRGVKVMKRLGLLMLLAGVGLHCVQPGLAAAPSSRPGIIPGLNFPSASSSDTSGNADPDIDGLVKILEDDKARARLIERLKKTATADEKADVSPPEPVAVHLANFSALLFQHLRSFLSVWQMAFRELLEVLHGTSRLFSWHVLMIFRNMAGVAAGTFAAFYAVRWIAARLSTPVWLHRPGSFAGKVLRLLTIVLLDVGTVVIAWLAGEELALLIEDGANVTAGQEMFLRSFLLVESFRVALRAIFTPRLPHLRFLKMGTLSEANHRARLWYSWLAWSASVFGYSFLMVIPLMETVSIDGGRALETLTVLSALIVAIWFCIIQRREGRIALTRLTNHGSLESASDIFAKLGAVIAAIWHAVVTLWLTALFICWLSMPWLLPFVLRASIYSVVILLVGGFALSRLALLHNDVPVADRLKRAIPLLNIWLRRLINPLRRILRLTVFVVTVLGLLQVWAVVDVVGWLQTDAGKFTLSAGISVLIVLGCSAAIYLLVISWIEKRLLQGEEHGISSRERTLLSLFRNAFSITMAVIVVLAILSQLGVNTAPLLAGAGVFGLAIGFGSQKLVQDIINGMFIQFENAMNEGDVVEAAGIQGTVEKLTIRSVAIRSVDGIYHLIPFSSVDRVSNHNRIFSMHAAVVRIGHRASIPDTKAAMFEAFDRLMQTEHAGSIIGTLDMQGVIDLSPAIISIRARIKTLPGEQWIIGRAYNEIVKNVLEEHGIEIAVPGMRLFLDEVQPGTGHQPA